MSRTPDEDVCGIRQWTDFAFHTRDSPLERFLNAPVNTVSALLSTKFAMIRHYCDVGVID